MPLPWSNFYNLPIKFSLSYVNNIKANPSKRMNLGVQIDHHLSFEPQIMSLKKHCFRLLRNVIGRKYLFSKAQLKLIINSIIVCKLDYCNALYYGISDNLIHQLQLVQNAAAKAIVGLYKYDHLGDTLKDLHWLPISYRIQYKILLLVYKCLNGMGPDYLNVICFIMPIIIILSI